MKPTPELKEILGYLDKRDDYAIYAGFAAFLHTGIDTERDVDIFLSKRYDAEKIGKEFIAKGWKVIRKETDKERKRGLITLKKKDTTFDMWFTDSYSRSFSKDRKYINFAGYRLITVSTETLFLTKLNVLALPRPVKKTQRDRKVISILRKRIDGDKLKRIIATIPENFWREIR